MEPGEAEALATALAHCKLGEQQAPNAPGIAEAPELKLKTVAACHALAAKACEEGWDALLSALARNHDVGSPVAMAAAKRAQWQIESVLRLAVGAIHHIGTLPVPPELSGASPAGSGSGVHVTSPTGKAAGASPRGGSVGSHGAGSSPRGTATAPDATSPVLAQAQTCMAQCELALRLAERAGAMHATWASLPLTVQRAAATRMAAPKKDTSLNTSMAMTMLAMDAFKAIHDALKPELDAAQTLLQSAGSAGPVKPAAGAGAAAVNQPQPTSAQLAAAAFAELIKPVQALAKSAAAQANSIATVGQQARLQQAQAAAKIPSSSTSTSSSSGVAGENVAGSPSARNPGDVQPGWHVACAIQSAVRMLSCSNVKDMTACADDCTNAAEAAALEAEGVQAQAAALLAANGTLVGYARMVAPLIQASVVEACGMAGAAEAAVDAAEALHTEACAVENATAAAEAARNGVRKAKDIAAAEVLRTQVAFSAEAAQAALQGVLKAAGQAHMSQRQAAAAYKQALDAELRFEGKAADLLDMQAQLSASIAASGGVLQSSQAPDRCAAVAVCVERAETAARDARRLLAGGVSDMQAALVVVTSKAAEEVCSKVCSLLSSGSHPTSADQQSLQALLSMATKAEAVLQVEGGLTEDGSTNVGAAASQAMAHAQACAAVAGVKQALHALELYQKVPGAAAQIGNELAATACTICSEPATSMAKAQQAGQQAATLKHTAKELASEADGLAAAAANITSSISSTGGHDARGSNALHKALSAVAAAVADAARGMEHGADCTTHAASAVALSAEACALLPDATAVLASLAAAASAAGGSSSSSSGGVHAAVAQLSAMCEKAHGLTMLARSRFDRVREAAGSASTPGAARTHTLTSAAEAALKQARAAAAAVDAQAAVASELAELCRAIEAAQALPVGENATGKAVEAASELQARVERTKKAVEDAKTALAATLADSGQGGPAGQSPAGLFSGVFNAIGKVLHAAEGTSQQLNASVEHVRKAFERKKLETAAAAILDSTESAAQDIRSAEDGAHDLSIAAAGAFDSAVCNGSVEAAAEAVSLSRTAQKASQDAADRARCLLEELSKQLESGIALSQTSMANVLAATDPAVAAVRDKAMALAKQVAEEAEQGFREAVVASKASAALHKALSAVDTVWSIVNEAEVQSCGAVAALVEMAAGKTGSVAESAAAEKEMRKHVLGVQAAVQELGVKAEAGVQDMRSALQALREQLLVYSTISKRRGKGVLQDASAALQRLERMQQVVCSVAPLRMQTALATVQAASVQSQQLLAARDAVTGAQAGVAAAREQLVAVENECKEYVELGWSDAMPPQLDAAGDKARAVAGQARSTATAAAAAASSIEANLSALSRSTADAMAASTAVTEDVQSQLASANSSETKEHQQQVSASGSGRTAGGLQTVFASFARNAQQLGEHWHAFTAALAALTQSHQRSGSLASQAAGVAAEVDALLADAEEQLSRLRVAKDALVRIEAARIMAQKALRDLEHKRINARELMNIGEAAALSMRVKQVQDLLTGSEDGLVDALKAVTEDVQAIWGAVTFNGKMKKADMQKSLAVALRVVTNALRCFVQYASLCHVVAQGANAFANKYTAVKTLDMARGLADQAVLKVRECGEQMAHVHKVIMALESKDGAGTDLAAQMRSVRDASKGYLKDIAVSEALCVKLAAELNKGKGRGAGSEPDSPERVQYGLGPYYV